MADPTRALRRRALRLTDAVARTGLSRPIETPRSAVRSLLGRLNEHGFSGQTAVVTGASSGVGEQTARRLAQAGATVVLVARREQELERVRDEIERAGGGAAVERCDLSDSDAVTGLGERLVAAHGPIDLLINNAGHSIRRPITESFDRLHDFERTMAINYFGPVALSLAILPSMLERGSGRIVNVSTWGTRIPSPQFAAYTASKAALDAFGRSVNAELHGSGVSMASVHLPLVRTPMIAPAQHEYRGMPSLSADEAAGLVLRAVPVTSGRVEPAFVTAVALADTVAGPLFERGLGRDAGPSAR